MSIRIRSVVAGLGVAALLAPGAAAAAPGKGKAPAKADVRAKSEKRAKSKKVKTVMYVVKGVYAGDDTLDVKGGNKHTRRAGLVGDEVVLDLTKAKFVVADTNGDDELTAADLKAGDKLVVQLRLPRSLGEDPAFVARKVIDQTNRPVESDVAGSTETPSTTDSQEDAA